MEVLAGLVLLAIVSAVGQASGPARALLSLLDDDQGTASAPSRHRAIPLAMLSGILLGAANALLIVALHAGGLAIVGVLVGLYPLATIVLARIVDDEHLDRVQATGVTVAILASLALSLA